MFDPSPVHIILLLVIVLLIFGTKKLPEVGRSLGRGIREFRGSVTGQETHAPVSPPSEAQTSATPPTGPAAADEALSRLEPKEAVAAKQAPPAPTPEVAVAEEAERSGAPGA
jgi:sec-independent protein translocase protein TatA